MPGVKHDNLFFPNMGGIPVSGTKLVHRASSNPQPIVVEKLSGNYVTPSQSLNGMCMTQMVQHEWLGACGGNSDKGSFSSRDTMDQALILAQLDIKKNKRNPNTSALSSTTVENEDVAEKVSKSVKTRQKVKQVYEVSNRPQRNASVQISRFPSRKKSPEPTPLSQLPVTTNSPPTHDKEPSSQEIQRLQGDIIKKLTELNDLLENLVKDCNNPKSSHSEEDQEATDTSQDLGALRALTRQVYIVRQQVADVERNLNTMHNYKTAPHTNKLGWTKSRLTSAYRGALKSLQSMTVHLRRSASPDSDPVFQLRLVELLSQLLQSVRILLDLYLQLTSIFSKNFDSACSEVLDLVDITDSLQNEWQIHLERKLKRLMSKGVQGGATSQHLPKKNSTNRSIQKNFRRQLSLDVTPERKSILRKPTSPSNPNRAVHRMTKKHPTYKKSAKSVIFPADIQIHRKPYEAIFNHNTYAQPTLSSRMKSLYDLQQEEESESRQTWQSSPTVAENGEEELEEEAEDFPGYSGQPLPPTHLAPSRMEKIGASIIEELLTLESKQKEKQEVKMSHPAATVNAKDKQDVEETENKQNKSLADVHQSMGGGGGIPWETIDLNLPPLEVLLHRLGEMESEQIKIRSRWASTRYHDTEAAAEECPKSKDSIQTANHQPRSLSPIFFSKKAGPSQSFIISQDQPQRSMSGEFPGSIRFTKKTSNKIKKPIQIDVANQNSADKSESKRTQFEGQQISNTSTQDYQGRKPKRLFLSNKILKNITENRQRYSSYLLNSAYHQVESFDPWRLTEELADSILDDCIQAVGEEMQDISHDLVNHLFNKEFMNLPPAPNTQHTPTRTQEDPSENPSIPLTVSLPS